ncbi:hypothetical protein GUJ93_ZPchr0004g39297 [Zizania palustris]|uniref:Exonuclease domain-containing protein n=1 Tax=Zizania palustris TaxID=103762 RepID=A0A8J5VPN9_ZIZPA|nr:hypothetical protein GUJ93_ZPchr0004g39297 [Zizania palustris]
MLHLLPSSRSHAAASHPSAAAARASHPKPSPTKTPLLVGNRHRRRACLAYLRVSNWCWSGRLAIQLRNNIWSSFPVRFLKQQAGLSCAKLLDPRSFEKQHFTTKVQELGNEVAGTASWHITGPGPCIAGTQPLNFQKYSEHDQSGTVLIFDIETTGFLHKDHRIIEFALRDLSGGKNSTFETLINPERTVPNYAATVNKIDTVLVCRPDIPRFSDVIPLLLAFVRSRQVPGKPILWVAHNAKNFDAPFLAQEFDRCSASIPADWLFVDTLYLARRLVKADGKKRPINLEALREYYGIGSEGSPHRAMQDVMTLCKLTGGARNLREKEAINSAPTPNSAGRRSGRNHLPTNPLSESPKIQRNPPADRADDLSLAAAVSFCSRRSHARCEFSSDIRWELEQI